MKYFYLLSAFHALLDLYLEAAFVLATLHFARHLVLSLEPHVALLYKPYLDIRRAVRGALADAKGRLALGLVTPRTNLGDPAQRDTHAATRVESLFANFNVILSAT